MLLGYACVNIQCMVPKGACTPGHIGRALPYPSAALVQLRWDDVYLHLQHIVNHGIGALKYTKARHCTKVIRMARVRHQTPQLPHQVAKAKPGSQNGYSI